MAFLVAEHQFISKRKARESGRVLAFVLAFGAIAWIAAAILGDRTNDLGAPLWAFAMLMVAIGALSVLPRWQSVLSGLGALAVCAGALLLTVTLIRLLSGPNDPEASRILEMIAVGLMGGGAAVIGGSLILGSRSSPSALIVGGALAIAGLAWAVLGVTDYGSDTEKWVSILPALAFLALAIVVVRRPIPFLSRMMGRVLSR